MKGNVLSREDAAVVLAYHASQFTRLLTRAAELLAFMREHGEEFFGEVGDGYLSYEDDDDTPQHAMQLFSRAESIFSRSILTSLPSSEVWGWKEHFQGLRGSGRKELRQEDVNRIYLIAGAVNETCMYYMVSAFGQWGAHWLTMVPYETLKDLAKRFEALPREEIIGALLGPPSDDSDEAWQRVSEECRQWIYEQVMAGVKYDKIKKALKEKPTKWPPYTTRQGLKAAAMKYALEHELPLPRPRPPGRPRGS